jgi:TNF receptor-associated factor 4
MSGEYDDILEWPFYGEVTIELLNQLEDRYHHKMVVPFDESTPEECKSRVIGKERAKKGWGFSQFIFHAQLDVNPSFNCRYLKDDTLYFRVSAKVTSNTKPWLVA